MPTVDLESLKQTKTPPAWPRGFFFFSLTIFLIVLGAFLALNYFYLPQQENVLNGYKKEYQKIRNQFPLEKEEEIVLFEKRLNLLKKLLDQHSYFSKALLSLETITHPQVYYTNFEYGREKNSLNLQGIAKDQYVFSEAVNGLINHPEIVQTVIVKEMRSIASQSTTVFFSLEIIFNPNIFRFQ